MNNDKELEVASVRLTMAQAFGQLMVKAFDALLHHGVNYRNLPEYKDEALLDEAKTLPLQRGFASYMRWMERVENGLAAAVRRKTFRDVKED